MGRKSNAVQAELELSRFDLAWEVGAAFGAATKVYEESKAKFIKDVEINPANAISWGESMLIDQHKYVCWMKAAKRLEERGREGLEEHADDLLNDILIGVNSGRSSSQLSNANYAAEQYARRTVYESLKKLLANQ